MQNIILTGFMGTGKSTVGRLLAARLGYRFVDTDEWIVAQDGRSIPTIFAQSGEAAFANGKSRPPTRWPPSAGWSLLPVVACCSTRPT
jgi:shikimate kinase